MNEKEADAIRKSMYESLLMDENDKIVHWDFDPMRRELREYVDIACGCDEQTYGIRTPQFEYRYWFGNMHRLGASFPCSRQFYPPHTITYYIELQF